MNELRLRDYLVKAFTTGAVKTGLVTISTIVFLPLIIKKIGMEKYGLISMAMIFGGAVVVADFGVSKTVTYLLGKEENRGNPGDVISNALVINATILIIIGLFLAAVIALDVPVFGEEIKISGSLQSYIVVVGYSLLSLMLINNFLSAILEAYFLMHYVNISHALSSVTLNAFIYIACLLADSIKIILLAPVLAFSIVIFYMLIVVAKKTPAKLTMPRLVMLKGILGISTQFLFLGLINGFTMPLNKYLVTYLTGSSTAIGIFDLATKIALIASSLLSSIAQPLFGVFSSFPEEKKRIAKISSNTSVLLFFMYVLGVAFYFILGPEISGLIDSGNADTLFKVSMVLLIGLAFVPVAEPFYRALLGTAHLKVATKLKLILPLLNVALILLLPEVEGVGRIPVALSIAAFVTSLVTVAVGYSALKSKREE